MPVILFDELPHRRYIIRLNAFQHHGVVGEALSWETCDRDAILALHEQLATRVEHTLLLPRVY